MFASSRCSRNPLVRELVREQFANKPSLLCLGFFTKLAYFGGCFETYPVLQRIFRENRIISQVRFRKRRSKFISGVCVSLICSRIRNEKEFKWLGLSPWGFSGVILRGSGVAWDLRQAQPYEVF